MTNNEVQKRCHKCNQEKPLTDFYKNKALPKGYDRHCKECHKAYVKNYQIKNREEIRKKNLNYYHRNKIKILERVRLTQSENSEERKKYQREYYLKNREKILLQMRIKNPPKYKKC